MDNPQDSEPMLEGSLLFYSSPEPLNPDNHKNLKLRNDGKPFAFAADAQAIPLVVTEFQAASTSYPIIFLGDQLTPLAVTSIDGSGNLFVQPDGGWTPGAYMPAYLRRYPFVLAEETGSDRMLVCIERGSALFDENGDVDLFDKEGQPTDYTKKCISFCGEMEEDRQRTINFVEYLKSLDLFEMRQITQTTAQPDGSEDSEVRGQFWGISETKFKELPAEKLAEMRDNGALIAVYAHLNSQANWDKLSALEMIRRRTRSSAASPSIQ